MQPLEHVVEQLWAPALMSSEVRVAINPLPDNTWRTVEEYWLVPRESSARLLVPRAPRIITARSLTNYRRLRTTRVNTMRFVLGAFAEAGLPLSRDRVAVQVRTSSPDAEGLLPLTQISRALGRRMFAATGVRTSDNRKTTLHLLDGDGKPGGYAKIGWNRATDGFVANEARALRFVGGRPGPSRAPALLAELNYGGHPIAVTEPLPIDVRGSFAGVAPPTAEEMFSLTPIWRSATPAGTGQFSAMVDRLRVASKHPVVRPVAEDALDLAGSLASLERCLPVTERWHGDMTPWNRARDSSGQLWVWDWESSEDDALAGLDPLHWAFGSRRLTATRVDDVRLRDCLDDADHWLTAAGVARQDRCVVGATYGLSVVERACVLAAESGSWRDAYIQPAGLTSLVRQARTLLGTDDTEPI